MRLSEEELKKITARKGYGVGVAAHSVVKTAQRAVNALARSAVDPTPENLASAAKALLVAAAARGEIEAMFALQIMDAAPWRYAYAFQVPAMKGRKFRLDAAFIEPRIAFEVQGNAHRIKGRFYSDMERHNTLSLAGWRMFYVSGPMVRDGSGLELVRKVLA